jgi:toxin FitB
MYLLDTNVISEFRRKKPHGAVVNWLRNVGDAELFISAYSVGEIQIGIERTRENDKGKAAELEKWLQSIIETYSTLAMDDKILRFWAKLIHNKSDDLREDGLIAATAHVHNLTVVTRNEKHFKLLEFKVINPFKT